MGVAADPDAGKTAQAIGEAGIANNIFILAVNYDKTA